MTDKYACLPVATIATRIGVVELIYALAAYWAIAIVGRILIRPSRFIIGNRRVWVDCATADASKLVTVTGRGGLYFFGGRGGSLLFESKIFVISQ